MYLFLNFIVLFCRTVLGNSKRKLYWHMTGQLIDCRLGGRAGERSVSSEKDTPLSPLRDLPLHAPLPLHRFLQRPLGTALRSTRLSAPLSAPLTLHSHALLGGRVLLTMKLSSRLTCSTTDRPWPSRRSIAEIRRQVRVFLSLHTDYVFANLPAAAPRPTRRRRFQVPEITESCTKRAEKFGRKHARSVANVGMAFIFTEE